jgi:hypothetical protein
MTINQAIEFVKSEFTSIEEVDEILLKLRLDGFSQRDAVIILMKGIGATFSVSNRIVINSIVWEDNRRVCEAFGEIITSSEDNNLAY